MKFKNVSCCSEQDRISARLEVNTQASEFMTEVESRSSQQATSSEKVHIAGAPPSNRFKLPSAIRNLFDAFPWYTYAENSLPQRAAIVRSVNTFHIFALEGERFSPNPACLKWQAYLMAKGIPFKVVDSNNHASPTGALPFLLPAQRSKEPQPQAITSSKMQRWIEGQTAKEDSEDTQERVAMSMIEQNIRAAWLFYVYLKTENFESVAKVLYISSASRSLFVQKSLGYQLERAAQEEVLKTNARLDETEILAAAHSAFRSLEIMLDEYDFFSRSKEPGILDVSVFSYTYLILRFSEPESKMRPVWSDLSLFEALLKYEKLVGHANRVRDICLLDT